MNNLWADWRQASCLPDCWCEAARHGHWILEQLIHGQFIFYFCGNLYLLGSQ